MATNHELQHLLAGLALKGITRQQTARALYLSVSALNKKLRGAAPVFPEELARLRRLCRPDTPEEHAH